MNNLNEVADKAGMPCNKPRRSTRPGKKMMVKACEGGQEKIVHFGAKGYGHNYSSAARKSFRARHKCGEKKSKLSAQYWACRKLWAGKGGSTKSCPSNRQCKENFEPDINILSEENGEKMQINFVQNLFEKKMSKKAKMKAAKERIVKALKGKKMKPYRGRTQKQSRYAIATSAAKKMMESRNILTAPSPRKGKFRTGQFKIHSNRTGTREARAKGAEKRARVNKILKLQRMSDVTEEVVNKDHVPMSKSEIAARNRCYTSGKVKPGPALKGNDNEKNSVARKCTYIVLRSSRSGKGGALKKGVFGGKGGKKKAKKTIQKKKKSTKK